MDSRLKELLPVAVSLAIALFGVSYASAVSVANGGRWWISPLALMVGIVVGELTRYAFRRWTKKSIASGGPSA